MDNDFSEPYDPPTKGILNGLILYARFARRQSGYDASVRQNGHFGERSET